MSTRVVSEIQKVDSAIGDVYAFLSDFTKIGKMIEMARQMGAQGGQIGDSLSRILPIKSRMCGRRRILDRSW